MTERNEGMPERDAPRGGWPSTADFAVPALLAAVQLAGTRAVPALDDTGGGPLARWQWMVATVCVLLSCVALIWRRVAPARVLAATVLAGGAGVLLIGRADTLVGGVADGVALYSLAVHRGRRATVLGALAAWATAFLMYLPDRQGAGDVVMNEVFNGLFYIAVAALGQVRRQHKARRRELAAQLAAADAERRAAAAAERDRLARDLHDVAGHHLSAVVVHSGAAARVGDPDLSRQALSAAADTGRDVLDALTRLVDVVGPESDGEGLEELLPPLCQGLTRLGVPVSLAFEGRARRVRPQVVTAAYRIVQEALTNAMRYAPGAAVNVEVNCSSGAVRVSVVNAPPADESPVTTLGGGRGIEGMRERAEAFHGTLSAGPTPAGGWAVEAVLPTAPAGGRRGLGWPEVIDGIVLTFCAALPSLLAFAPPDAVLRGWPLAGGAAVVAGLTLRAAPLWWRRSHPYRTLLTLTAVDCAAAGLLAPYSLDLVVLLMIGLPAAMFAVYAVGRYATGRPTWPAPFVAVLAWGAQFGVLLAFGDETASRERVPVLVFGILMGYGFGLLVLLPFWAWGRTVARRGRRWEATALATMAARTGEAVLAERHRVALGLRGTVLDHTSRLVRAAEAGLAGSTEDAAAALSAVADEARAALMDMRALLDAMQEDTAPPYDNPHNPAPPLS
ncbi:sensor histidine kinase [Actinomadura kijaniata]|uniref:sensor histidine kinase n=1 Tax=Actinomadura kijaniata TaxID=46161 RepID=UPI0008356AC6|nr:histidine kinase [Actinomadura kijaniata]